MCSFVLGQNLSTVGWFAFCVFSADIEAVLGEAVHQRLEMLLSMLDLLEVVVVNLAMLLSWPEGEQSGP